MASTYSYGDNPSVDYVRLLVADTVAPFIFDDREIMAGYQIDTFAFWPPVGFQVTSGTPSYRRCAATLLDSLASNAARLASALKVLDIAVDTKTAATDLRAAAQSLRDTEANSGAFAMSEMVNDQFSARERTFKQLLRLYA
jgi:hypothetical protein